MLDMASELTHEALKQISTALSGANVGIFFHILEISLGRISGTV